MIERCETFDFLGVVFDQFITWNDHIKKLHQKLSYSLYQMRKIKNLLNYDNLKRLYYSIVHSHIEYGMLLWSNTSTKNINIIQKLQKRALRIVHKVGYNHPTEQLLQNANILNIEKTIDKHMYVLMYRYTNDQLPRSIRNLFICNQDVHQYHTRQKNNPHIKKHKRQTTLNSFLHKSPLKWQNLPISLKNKPSKSCFVNKIKKYLMTN